MDKPLGTLQDLPEEKLKKLLDLLKDLEVAYFQADREGRTIDPTEAEGRITGYSIEELRGLNRERLYSDPSDRKKLIERARRKGGRLTLVLQPMVKKDGTPIWVEGDLRIVKDEKGDEVGLEGFYRDVTERIQLQGFLDLGTDRVVDDRELFERVQNARFDLDYLTSLGHQLQTPLGALVETLRNFERGRIDQEKLQERLPYVIGQVLVCSRLVRNLSYMDKILRGERFRKEKVPLSKLAVETAIDFQHLLREKRLELEIDKESLRRHLVVEGHIEMLRQVVVNLVDNAVKYSRPGSCIRICGLEWPPGRVLEISNEGFPLRPEEEEKIFERGFRTRHAKAAIPHGTGFGLWLVRKILTAHDAKIRCTQTRENGRHRIAFRIVFPHPASSSLRRAS